MSDTLDSFGPNPYGFDLSKGIHMGTIDDLTKFGEKFGESFLQQVLDLNKGYVDMAKSCVSLQYGYSRSCSSSKSSNSSFSGVSVGKAVGTPTSVGLLKTKLEAVGKLRTWRNSTIPDGFCYSKMFNNAVSNTTVAGIGAHPTIASLTRLSASMFLPVEDMLSFKLIARNKKQHHLTMGGSDGVPALAAIKSYAECHPLLPGSFGEALVRSPVSSSGLKYFGYNRVGADRVFKSEIGHCKVKLNFRRCKSSDWLDQLRMKLRDIPEVFDCLQVCDDHRAYISAAVKPTRADLSKFYDTFIYRHGGINCFHEPDIIEIFV